MKLVRYRRKNSPEAVFGFLEGNEVFAFSTLAGGKSGAGLLVDMGSYLQNLPDSHHQALEIRKKAAARRGDALVDISLLAPLEPAALLDFGLTPRHLINSARTMLRHEFGRLAGGIAASFVANKIRKKAGHPDLSYYKCNHQAVSGPDTALYWPLYTSWLDIEPELAFVTGPAAQPVAGYCIFNDISARDVQFPEMIGSGPARSKDFRLSNCLGPYLLTADELPDPLALKVSVRIGERFNWQGTTAEYSCGPEAVLDFLGTVFSPLPGTVIGMGTIPGCTGMDNDRWILPGDRVTITFAGLGTLTHIIPEPQGPLEVSRWKKRKELAAWYRE
ncbi:MAG: fumarylacetoacetate hydrolase family protein [Spirochaetales bacterium]|nr:fumarylacetoacetate hydrolase family protein [Spirochaetales bacterium]